MEIISKELVFDWIMHGSRKFCQSGSKFDNVFFFFLVDEGIEDPNITINGQSSAHQQNTIRWWADDGPILNASLVAL